MGLAAWSRGCRRSPGADGATPMDARLTQTPARVLERPRMSAPPALDLRRILVPTDFTETSDIALDWATALATRLGAAITVMHAYELPIVGFPEGAIVASAELATQIGQASRAALAALVARLRPTAVPVDAILREGIIWQEINAVAEAIDAGLVVIGTHGRKGLSRALLGSVADKVVRTSNRPIVTIRGRG